MQETSLLLLRCDVSRQLDHENETSAARYTIIGASENMLTMSNHGFWRLGTSTSALSVSVDTTPFYNETSTVLST